MDTSSIYDFLLSQPEHDLNDLYKNPWCALAVFQSLDELPRTIIMRLLFLHQTLFSFNILEEFISPMQRASGTSKAVYSKLKRLRIFGITEADASGSQVAFSTKGFVHAAECFAINTYFRSSLQRAILSSSGSPWESDTGALPPLKHSPQVSEIEEVCATYNMRGKGHCYSKLCVF